MAAVARQEAGPSSLPKPKPFVHRFRPNLTLIKCGKAHEPLIPQEKKEICTFCADELKAQEADELMRWRVGIAYALGHKNPEFSGKKQPVSEDVSRDCKGSSFTYLGDNDRRS